MAAGVAHAWTDNHLESIEDEQLASAVLELCLKHGGTQGVRMLQRALNTVMSKHVKWLNEDGVIGPATFEFVNALPADETMRALKRL